MGLFSKNKKNKKEEEKLEPKSSGKKKRNKKNIYSSLFNETVWETVIDSLRSNDLMRISFNGNEYYICLVLDLKALGIDKKSKKDEMKGSFLEAVKSGRIETIVDDELLDEGLILIIPTATNILAMEEWSMLTNNPYELCRVNASGDKELLSQTVTYQEVRNILTNDINIMDSGLLDEKFYDKQASNTIDDDIVDDDIVDDVVDDVADDLVSDNTFATDMGGFDDLSEFEDDEEGISYPSQAQTVPDMVSPQNMQPQSDFENVNQVTPQVDALNVAMAEPQTKEAVFVPENISDTLYTRKFYSDDLGLEVNLNAFNSQFMTPDIAVYRPFSETREKSWLNDNLNELSRQANCELQALREQHLFSLKNYYFKLLSNQCDNIVEELNIHNDTTSFGALYANAKATRDNELNNVDGTIAEKRKELEQAWSNKVEEVGLLAARNAMSDYKNRYGFHHDELMANVERDVKASITADFNDTVHEMLIRRKAEASVLLDLATTETLNEITDMFGEMLKEENMVKDRFNRKIEDFAEENRKNEVFRVETINKELSQRQEADLVLAQQTSKIQAMSDEYNRRKMELTEELSRLRVENKEKLEAMKFETENQIRFANEEKANMQKRYDSLLEKFENMDAEKDSQYKSRILEKENEVKSWKARSKHIEEVHKRSSKLMTFMFIAVAIMCAVFGFVAGEWSSSKKSIESMQTQYTMNDSTNE